MSDLRQSPQYANYLSQLGWVVEKLNGHYIYLKKIPLLGYFAKIQRVEKVDGEALKLITQKYKPFRVVVEPLTPIINTKAHYSLYHPYLPTKTLLIDISKSEKEIVAGFKKDVRRAIAKSEVINSKFETLNTHNKITVFRKTWRKAVPWTRYVPSLKNLLALKKSFGDNCLFLCHSRLPCHPRESGDPDWIPDQVGNDSKSSTTSSIVFLIANKTLYYYLAWSNKRISHTADMYRLVWEGIKWGKSRGCTRFDFEGIYDTRFPNKSWLGFSHFKSRFGGQEILYPGCYLLNP